MIDILSRYKFTIEENTPVEEEVALDPELLGKVFENLLASYNEETETTARKLTGSFYTPREIVNYMVDESLITYLCNSLLPKNDESKSEDLNKRLHHLFTYTIEEPQFTDAEKSKLIDAIDNCKILDPACGSGAFPMGILHKLVFILSKLDHNNKHWKQKQLDKAKRDFILAEKMEDDKIREAATKDIELRITDIDKAFNQNNHELDFARKLYLIENCIYGVDKQPVAIQISKLRFFIALIVDQKTDSNNEPNRGIRPLPNLETKFVAADTLVSIEKPSGLLVNLVLEKEIKEKETEIHKVREKHFRARTPDTKEKYRLLDTLYRNELANLLEQDGFPKDATKKLAGWNPYDQNKYADFFDPMWMFEIENGFDIVIGNPPYGIKFSNSEKQYLRNKFKDLEFKIDSYEVFILKAITQLAPNGICSYIIPSNLMDNFFTKKIRHKLLTQTQVLEATELDDKVFEAVIHSMILSFANKHVKEYNINCRIDKSIESSITKIPNTFFINEENHTFFFRKFLYLDLINTIYKNSNKLENYLRLKDGIDTGDNKKYISENKIDKHWKKIIGGQDVDRWVIKNHNYVDYGNHLANPRDISIFEQEKILIRETGNRIIATFDDENYYALSTLYIGNNINEKVSIKSILCLLNSNVYHFLMYLIAFSRTEGAFTKTRIFHYYGLPVPKAIITNNRIFEELCERILYINNKLYDINEIVLLNESFAQILNGCVYELYFSEEMKKTGVDILALVQKDLEAAVKLVPEQAIAVLYKKWQEPKNEVRNRLLLMPIRCPETIGVIESIL